MSAEAALDAPARRREPGALRRLFGQPMAALGMAIVAFFVLAAIAAPILPIADPALTLPANRLAPPFSSGHLLGTDQLGRDILSRIVWGLRVSLAVGAVATLSAAVVGATIGLIAAFYGRLVGATLMRFVDVLMAFPYLLLALAVVAALGPGLVNAGLAIAIVNVPFFARSVRGAALGVVGRDYVDAARLAGFSDLRILLTEVLPNVAPLLIVTAATTIGWMILETAGLSFLGLGAQPPQADLGSMLGDGRKVVAAAPHVAAIPGLVTFVLVVGLNLLGDGLRDLLDPRMKGGQGGAPAPATAVERAAPTTPPFEGRGARALDIRNLTVAFDKPTGRHAAVRDVSFALRPGEALGIVGESGSGKSTLARVMVGLLAPDEGQVATAGERFDPATSRGRAALRRRAQFVFQDAASAFNPRRTIGRSLEAPLVGLTRLGGAARRERVAETLELVGLRTEHADRHPHEFSGGQLQRAGIARALVSEPDVVALDEPVSALDVSVQAQILALLKRLRAERGLTMIFVSHDLAVVETLCDRVAVMRKGRVVEEGACRAVLAEPCEDYTRALVAAAGGGLQGA